MVNTSFICDDLLLKKFCHAKYCNVIWYRDGILVDVVYCLKL